MMRNNGHYSGWRLSFVCAVVLAATLLTPPARADSLGRLFFTPEQRAQLEQNLVRHATADAGSAAPAEKEPDNTETAEEEDNTSSLLTVNGIVQKRGGARIVWINGVAQNAGSSDERAPESLVVTIPGKAQSVRVKVGQKLLLESTSQRKPAEQKPAKVGDEED